MSAWKIPSIWRFSELREFAVFVSGGTPSRKNPNYFRGSIPWLTGYDLPEGRIGFIDGGREHITEEALSQSATNLVPPKTILLTTRVTVGKVAVAQKSLCFSQDVTGIIVNNTDIIDPVYIAHYLLAVREMLLHKSRGTTIQGIIRQDLERIQVPLPSLSEQRHIVDILRQADELRHLRQEIINHLSDLAVALFNDVFGDPVLNPKKWTQLPIEPRCEVKPGPFGSSLKKEIYTSSGYRVYGQEQVITGDFTIGDYYVSEEKFREMKDYAVQPGDILISLVGTIGKARVVPEDVEPGIINPRVLKITPNSPEIKSVFLASLMQHPSIQAKLGHLARGGTMDVLNAKLLKMLKIPIPPRSLQDNFESRLKESTYLEKLQLETQSKTENLFKSLLARSFSGELTDIWRERYRKKLAEEARQRDEALGLRPTGLESEEKPSAIFIDKTHPRYTILQELSSIQQQIYQTVQQTGGYFTAENLISTGDLPPEIIHRTLALLEAIGLVSRVSLSTSPTGDTLFYITAYRALQDIDNSRDDDLAILNPE